MYSLGLVLACLACAGNGLRLQAALQQYSGGQDTQGQKLTKQLSTDAVSRIYGRETHSGVRLVENAALPRKAIAMLLVFFTPATVFAPTALNRTMYAYKQKHTFRNHVGVNAESQIAMMDEHYLGEAPPAPWGPAVRVVVSVDWEGLDLEKRDLHFFEDFRRAHPEVPLTHFLSAAYLTKSEGQSIHEFNPSAAFKPIDQYGLYLHGFKSLVEASGVQYRSGPSTLKSPEKLKESQHEEKELRRLVELHLNSERCLKQEKELQQLMEKHCPGRHKSSESEVDEALGKLALYDYLSRDPGYDTDISAYDIDELRAIISKSKAILEAHGLKLGKSFRAGTWLAGQNVMEAAWQEGFRVNSSAINFDSFLRNLPSEELVLWRETPFAARVDELWHDITAHSQPYLVETSAGCVLEMPVSGGPAESTTAREMVEHIDEAVRQLDTEDVFVHLSFVQETAAEFGPRVTAAIAEVKQKHGHRVVFETLAASARRALSTQRLIELLAKIHPAMPQNSRSREPMPVNQK